MFQGNINAAEWNIDDTGKNHKTLVKGILKTEDKDIKSPILRHLNFHGLLMQRENKNIKKVSREH